MWHGFYLLLSAGHPLRSGLWSILETSRPILHSQVFFWHLHWPYFFPGVFWQPPNWPLVPGLWSLSAHPGCEAGGLASHCSEIPNCCSLALRIKSVQTGRLSVLELASLCVLWKENIVYCLLIRWGPLWRRNWDHRWFLGMLQQSPFLPPPSGTHGPASHLCSLRM